MGSDLLVPEAWVERLARIALALPDAYQEEAWVGERWRVRGRTFAHVLPIEAGRPEAYSRAVGSPGPHVVMTFRADPEELEAITRSGPSSRAASLRARSPLHLRGGRTPTSCRR